MNIKEFEKTIISTLISVVENIIIANPTLPIAVRQGERQGDAISKFLENAFVEATQNHAFLCDSQASPVGKTKNPYDVETFFRYKEHKELIWIDFKAVNIANEDSNPDSGTPDKIITLINNGSFYLAYIFVFYEGNNQNLTFVRKDEQLVKAYFLKDISPTVRITPANQLQVNYSQPPVYRTREEFIAFLIEKKKESFHRQFQKAVKALQNLENGIVLNKITLSQLLEANKTQETKIKNL